MNDLHVQRYLRSMERNGMNPLLQLHENFGIKVNRHSTYPNLVSLKYCQITSPKANPIVRDCRGIVLDSKNDWKAVAMGYRRFFNYGEEEADPVDFGSSRFFTKADGSLILLYGYLGKWQVATSGTPDADTPTSFDPSITYEQLFWEIFESNGYKLPEGVPGMYTYMFELCSPRNPVVVAYPEDKLILHGVRNMITLREESFHDAYMHGMLGWDTIQEHNFDSWEDVVSTASSLKGEEGEGFIAVDVNYNRVKIKGEDYVKIHHLKSSLSIRRILDVIKENETDELLAILPGLEPLITSLIKKYENLIQGIMRLHASGISQSDKEFAIANEGHPLRGCAFMLRKNNLTAREALNRLSNRAFEGLMQVKRSEMTPMARAMLDESNPAD